MNDLIGQTIGQYRIVEKIGKGGMANVYKAYQPSLDRYVAIKILPEYFLHDETFLARFQREAKAVAKLSHSHILPVYDFGQQEKLTYIVMQYVEAGTLRDMLDEPLALHLAAEIIDQIASALDYAHKRGIIHRDVKPSNVLMEEGERVLLSDFGLAKMVEASVQLTGSGVGVGTPAYMSPEQGQGEEVDVRSDVYSLGIVLYEMATGRVPYTAETPMAVVLKHVIEPLPLPRIVNPALPEAVERVILKALAKNPTDRFASAGEMAQALQSAVAGLPVAAEPTPTEVVAALPTEPEVPVTEPAVAPAPPAAEELIPAAALKRGVTLPLAGIVAGVAVVLLLLLVVVVAGVVLLRGRGAEEPGPTPAAAGTVTPPATQPAAEAVQVRESDGAEMVFVPAGEFTMGSEVGEGDEKPVHQVYLDAFWIDKTEVTNAQYRECVAAGKCKASGVAGDAGYNGDAQPVVGVNWNDANAYCEWAGARLPTEAEWEMAARGPDGRVYPWGNEGATCEYAVMDDGSGGGCGQDKPWPVGSKPQGASPYGALDMAGNVWEWTDGWYQAYPGSSYRPDAFGEEYRVLGDSSWFDSLFPKAEAAQEAEYRVLRGGSWIDSQSYLRCAHRNRADPDVRNDDVGFRCALSAAATALPPTAPTPTSPKPTAEVTPAAAGTVTPPAPQPAAEAVQVRESDGAEMVFVPAGEFTMGSEVGEDDEKPVHQVYLDAFWIDKTEVTNAQYRKCVEAGMCMAFFLYHEDPDLSGDAQPVVGMNWKNAQAYCEWAGARLPTEAEWEMAARGTDGRVYPWGNEGAACKYAVMDDGSGGGCGQDKPWPVGSKPQGASPYGALDMAGNVGEWVADWYAEDYHVRVTDRNPTGPVSGKVRVVRGGSWRSYQQDVRCANRDWVNPLGRGDNVGFRCALSATATALPPTAPAATTARLQGGVVEN